ncbi:MAG: PHP domain-containing protein, partial [Phycisphaerales bacterium]|nr:PHP domain-containing protein [Phycisphaerales bacterium]
MPDNEFPKIKAHPFREAQHRSVDATSAYSRASTPYAELSVTSNYTFLRGASHPEEFVERAAELGHAAAAIADTNTMAGVVRAHVAAKEAGIPLAVGSRLVLEDGPDVLAFATDRPSYSRLSRLLTLGKRRAPKGECHLVLHDLLEHQEGLLAIVMPPRVLDDDAIAVVRGLRGAFGDRLSLAAARGYHPGDAERLDQLASLSHTADVPLVAVNEAHYHGADRRALQDVLTCIRHGCTMEAAGYRLHPNAERHLKAPDEMARLFRDFPGAVERSAEIALSASAFSMDELRYQYPSEACPAGVSASAYLRQATMAGATWRYGDDVPELVRGTIEHELSMIAELGYEAYFLTCYDIVNFARSRGILCQGRGGAANSAVCYCLGITEVDPATHHLLFERFISRSRGEPPDIDIDFEHERREEVIQYLYQKYGRERAALTAEVITYRGRSAVREVGKAMGLSLDGVDALAKNLDRWGDDATPERVREAGFDPEDPTIAAIIGLTRQLIGFPRHLSQHVGGFVITEGPLHDLVPIENAAMEDRTVIEWDKDDIDAMGMLKVDCLGLGMLTCVRKALEMVVVGATERWS